MQKTCICTGINKKYYPWMIVLAAIIVRLAVFFIYLESGQMYCDEAMTLLNARMIADRGTDIFGEQLPLYFDTWIYGGQSPFATYIIAGAIKLFGYSLTITRLPILVFDISLLLALYGLARELFNDGKRPLICLVIAAVSPWSIFQAVWTLDCAFLPTMLTLGLCFIARAANGKSTVNYAASMLCFGSCFYCYIASVLVIPPLLAAAFLIMILKKRISFSQVLLCTVVLFTVSAPFILSGLVTTGIIPEFNALGFSFTKMDNYSRGGDVLLNYIGATDFLHFSQKLLLNLAGAFVAIIIPDISFLQVGMSTFSYAHFLGAILFLVGLMWIVFCLRKKSDISINRRTGLLLTAYSIAAVFYCGMVCGLAYHSLHRIACIFPLLYIVEAIGADAIKRRIENKNTKKINTRWWFAAICVFSVISTFFLIGKYYIPQSIKGPMFGKSLDECVLYAESAGAEEIVFKNSSGELREGEHYEDRHNNEQQAVFIRLFRYEEFDDFTSVYTDLRHRGFLSNYIGMSYEKNIDLKSDGSWRYEDISPGETLSESCYIVFTHDLPLLAIEMESYDVVNYGYYSVIIRKPTSIRPIA